MHKVSRSITAVIIVRNEEKTVRAIVEQTAKLLPKIAKRYEILVNDDASYDKTPKILDLLCQKYPFIKVFHQHAPLGIRDGWEFLYPKSKYQLVFTNSADGEYSVKELPKMLEKIDQGFDLVIGKRVNKQYKLKRKLISYLFNLLPSLLFGYNLYDAGSIKLYKKAVLKNTLPLSKSVFSEGERIIRAYRLGYKVTSIPISHFPRKGSSASGARMGLVWAATFDMFKFRLKLLKKGGLS